MCGYRANAATLALASGLILAGTDPLRGQCHVPWSDPAPLNNNAATDSGSDEYPQITTDGSGNWVAVWTSFDDLEGTIGTDKDILVARSSNDGLSWTDPEPLNNNAIADTGNDEEPQVTTDGGGIWVAVWSSRENLGGTIGGDYDILFARSSDNGQTWSDPAPLNSNAATDSGDDLSPKPSTDEAGHWVAMWSSPDTLGGSIGGDWDILFSASNDDGQSWSDPAPLNSNAATDSGNDWATRGLTTDRAGNWVAVWHSSDTLGGTIGNDQDILVARSSDNGQTWTGPVPLNNNAAVDSGFDVGAKATTDGVGNWAVVWMSVDTLGGTIGTDRDILVTLSSDNGQTWSDPAPLNNNAATDSGNDHDPQIATDETGNWVAVWSSYDDLADTVGTDADIIIARSSDNGLSWTDPAPLNTNATMDSGLDRWAQITPAGPENWLAVWVSNDTFGGTIGTDQDILVAGFQLIDCNGNGTIDICDIQDGSSPDENDNGIPDECEDCNENGIPDPCDLDCGVPGGPCDVAGCGSSPDCQPNGVPDECDIAERRGRDKFPRPHGDGIPDVCQLTMPEEW